MEEKNSSKKISLIPPEANTMLKASWTERPSRMMREAAQILSPSMTLSTRASEPWRRAGRTSYSTNISAVMEDWKAWKASLWHTFGYTNTRVSMSRDATVSKNKINLIAQDYFNSKRVYKKQRTTGGMPLPKPTDMDMTKHSDYFVWKDTAERVAWRCDCTVW